MPELRAGIYKHYRGLLVQVLGIARHSESNEKLVAYVPLGVKAGPRITVRPYDMFFEEVDINESKQPHFKFIGEEVGEDLAKEYSPDAKKGPSEYES